MRLSRPIKGAISEQEANYLALMLEHAKPEVNEAGLERLCQLHRQGYALSYPHKFHLLLTGLLALPYPKVRRWALNGIAAFGSSQENLGPTLVALSNDRDNEDILGAGVAALVSLLPPDELKDKLHAIDIPLEGVTLLAAAQQTDAFTAQIMSRPINIDGDAPAELRLSCVLVGLGKAPEHLFSERYANSDLIGQLNSHNDRKVAQYSIWATCENPKLSIANLGVRLQDMQQRPDNVRGWIYQLVGQSLETAKANLDLIQVGTADTSEDARLGLATGLKETYFGGLEGVVFTWSGSEASDSVKAGLLDHMTVNAEESALYKEVVLREFAEAGSKSLTRSRMLAIAARTPLYADLMSISLRQEGTSLFGDGFWGGSSVTNNYTFGNNNQIGIVGGGTIHGGVRNVQTITEAQQQLDQLIALLKSSTTAGASEGIALAEAAKKEPSKSAFKKIGAWFKGVKEITGAALGAEENIEKIIGVLDEAADYLF